jgi:hypothetical protein
MFGKTKTPVSSTYFGLTTAVPIDSTNGSGLSEPNYGYGYSRKSYSNSSTGYSATVFAKKVVSNVATLLTESDHSLSAGQNIYVYLGDPQFDKNNKFIDNWTSEYASVASVPTTTSLTYSLTTSNVGGSISSISRTSNVVTVTISAAHNLSVGQTVYIDGVSDNTFNGIYQIVSSASTTTFTYSNSGADGSSSSGSVYSTTAGTVNPFYNIVGTRQYSSTQASLFTDSNPSFSGSEQLQIFGGQSIITPTVISSSLVALSIGAPYVTNNVTVSSSQASLNLISYVNSTFETSTTASRTDTWTVTGTGTTTIVDKSTAGDFKALQLARTSGNTTTFTSGFIPATAASKYGIGIDYLANLTGTATLSVSWYNGATIIGTAVTVQTMTGLASSWTTLYEAAFTAPTNTTQAKISLALVTASGAATAKIRKPVFGLVPTIGTVTVSGSGLVAPALVRITAITPTGETLPSAPVSITTNSTGSVNTVNLTAYSGATAYRVYVDYGVSEDSVLNQSYLDSLLVKTITASGQTFAGTDIVTTGYTKTRLPNWYPGGYSITLSKNVSTTEADSYTADTVVSPSAGGVFGYAKSLPNWQPSIDGKIYNGKQVVFGPATADWGTLRYWFMSDAATGGNVIAFGEFIDPINIILGDSITIPTNGVTFSVFSGYGA